MILVDANLLIYAHVSGLPAHERAREWLDSVLNDHAKVGLSWPSILAFVRLTTNPRVFERPMAIADAWAIMRGLLACAQVWVPVPTERHADILDQLLPAAGGRANLVPDAHLAALALEHGLLLCSADGDFARFPGLRWQNPLA